MCIYNLEQFSLWFYILSCFNLYFLHKSFDGTSKCHPLVYSTVPHTSCADAQLLQLSFETVDLASGCLVFGFGLLKVCTAAHACIIQCFLPFVFFLEKLAIAERIKIIGLFLDDIGV